MVHGERAVAWRSLWAFGNRNKHVAANLLGFERHDKVKLSTNATDQVHAEQIENFLSLLLNVSKIDGELVLRVEQLPEATPM